MKIKHAIKTLTCCSSMLVLGVLTPISVYAELSSEDTAKMISGPAPKGKAWEPAWGYWKAAPQYWLPTHFGFVKESKKGDVNILFFGDSITKGWSGAGKEIWQKNYQPLKSLNIGIGGDTTRQSLWRIEHEALAGIQPKVVVLMIGVNNIFTGTGSDEEIAKGVAEIIKQIQAKSPKSKVLLIGILPLGNEAQSKRAKAINSILAGLQSKSVRFLDMSPQFLDKQGKVLPELYRPDRVHLEKPGYVVWDKTMMPILKEMLK